MPKVTFLSVNRVCEAKKGETILDVAINHDIPLQHACGGFCACTTCHVLVKVGGNQLSEIEEDELDRLEKAPPRGRRAPEQEVATKTETD